MWSNHGPQFLFVLLCTLAAVVQVSRTPKNFPIVCLGALLLVQLLNANVGVVFWVKIAKPRDLIG
jgi:hypothetical protein